MRRISTILTILVLALSASARSHTIAQGETVQSIAGKYGLTVDDLKKANPQVRYYVNGVILTIPEATKSVGNKATQSAANSKPDMFAGAGEYAFWKNNYTSKDKKVRQQAIDNLVKACEAGNVVALFDYYKALLYGNRKGINKDEAKAHMMLVESAKRGYAKAKLEVYETFKYSTNRKYLPAEVTDKVAVEWFDEAVDEGLSGALDCKARDYLNGFNGMPCDTAKACEFYLRILNSDFEKVRNDRTKYDVDDQLNYERAYKELLLLTDHLPRQGALKKAKDYDSKGLYAAADVFYRKAAEGGDAQAMARLGDFYSEGLWHEKDMTAAESWWKKASSAGDMRSKKLLAKIKEDEANKAALQQKAAEERKAAEAERKARSAQQKQLADNKPKEKEKSKFDDVMEKIGGVLDALDTAVNDMAAIKGSTPSGQNQNQSQNQSLPQEYSGADNAVNDVNESAEDYYYIPDVIAELDRIIEDQKSQINYVKTPKTRTIKNSNGKQFNVRTINHSDIYVYYDSPNNNSHSSIAAHYTEIKKSVLGYGTKNRTDYIPVSRYNKIRDAYHDAWNKNLEANRKYRKDESKAKAQNLYQGYVSRLIKESYSNDGRNMKWIRQEQRNMKNLREKHGLKKSPWEDWDGVHDP